VSHRDLSPNTNALVVKIGKMATSLLHWYWVQALASTLINSLAVNQLIKNFIFANLPWNYTSLNLVFSSIPFSVKKSYAIFIVKRVIQVLSNLLCIS
jgi:hypothetical protein